MTTTTEPGLSPKVGPQQTDRLVIFGAGPAAEALSESVRQTGRLEPVAFVVDTDYYVGQVSLNGLPVVAFEHLVECFPPTEHRVLLALGWAEALERRRLARHRVLAAGFELADHVAVGAHVWHGIAFPGGTVVHPGAVIEPFVELGPGVTVRANAVLSHHSSVGADSFLANGAVTGGRVVVGERVWIGLGAVIRDGVTLGDRSFVGAGAVVVEDTEPDGVYVGVPARRLPGVTSLDATRN
jgi:sugar O-acyltransferase (sialic acid O-acetyltransferase NeuD family)